MRKTVATIAAAVLTLGASAPASAQPALTFFVAAQGLGKGGDLGGLAGADARCAEFGYRAGMGDLTWHAYLSVPALDGKEAVNARDRIGAGPWYNANLTLIARNVAELHSDANPITKAIALDDRGEAVPGLGENGNRHEILTGSRPDGTAFTSADGDTSCNGWTSSASTGSAVIGHHDLAGDGDTAWSWNSAGKTKGCGQADFQATGGAGLFYCFGFAN